MISRWVCCLKFLSQNTMINDCPQHHDAPAGFPFEATAVRRRMGLGKEAFRILRKTCLQEGDSIVWKKRVFLSAEALSKLSQELHVPELEKSAAAQCRPTRRDPAPVIRELKVFRTQLLNNRIILACPPEENEDRPKTVLRVRIQPGAKLMRRSLIHARSIPPYTDYFEHIPNFRRAAAARQSREPAVPPQPTIPL